MYAEQLLIDYIKANSSFTNVAYAEEISIKATSFEQTLPRIEVGHLGIKLQHPEVLFANGYSEWENPKMLITQIVTICLRKDFPVVWEELYKAYTNFTPFALDSDYSHVIYLKGDAVGKTQEHIIWADYIGIAFPRAS